MTRAFAAIPDSNLQIMEHLHTFRFLTPAQMLRLGVATHINSLRRTLRRFETSRKYVEFAEFGVLPKIGRLPRVYYLTERGARYLAELWRTDPKVINYPKGVKLFSRDYFHRTATIDFHIELRLYAERHGLTVEFFHSYFDTTGANRTGNPADRLQRLSKVPLEESFFIPDGIFAVHDPDNKRYLYALEIYNGFNTKRVHEQMEKHLIALGEGQVSELYQYPKAHRVLCVFEQDNALKAAEKRLREDEAFTEKMRRQFALTTLPAIRENFAANWLFLERGRSSIFDSMPQKQQVKAHKGVRQLIDRLGI